MSRLINARELKRRYDLEGPVKCVEHLTDALTEGHLKSEDFSLRELAESLVPDGREWVASLNPRRAAFNVIEAHGAVDTSAFTNITGQIVYSKVLQGYQNENFIFSSLIPSTPTQLDGEKIPGMSKLGDQAEIVGEGEGYPSAGFSEDWIETPRTTKRGFIVPVTKEAIFFDRIGLVLKRASEVGESMGISKEKRLIDTVIGVNNPYKWKGTSYSTYQASTPWINVKSSNDLVDWTDVDAVDQLFADMLDPYTGEPVLISAPTVIVNPARLQAAARVFNATELRFGDGASATTQQVFANPMAGRKFMSSRLMYRRIQYNGGGSAVSASDAAAWWFMGDFPKAFAYMENWPVTVTQAPSNSEAEFSQDIVARFKASERGVAAVLDPRFVVKSYQA